MIVPLRDATDVAVFGGKAVQLGAAIRAGLPVPPGYAISVDALSALTRDDDETRDRLDSVVLELGGPLAARSSAVGEDAEGASFAGQHVTMLNLHTGPEVLGGLMDVFRSAHSAGALAYRNRKGVDAPVEIAAVVQKLIDPRCAGVLFTRHPLTGADEFVIESAWGLGEAVVQGMVTPDHYRMSRDGDVIEQRVGDKPTAVRCVPGGTDEVDVDPDLVETPSLGEDELRLLVQLAHRCEDALGRNLDLEWAFAQGQLHLLQSRPITTRL